MVRIVLALLSLLTAHRSARVGQGRAAPAWSGADGPYPAQQLLQAIYDLGVSQKTLFTSGGGFHLKVVAGPSSL